MRPISLSSFFTTTEYLPFVFGLKWMAVAGEGHALVLRDVDVPRLAGDGLVVGVVDLELYRLDPLREAEEHRHAGDARVGGLGGDGLGVAGDVRDGLSGGVAAHAHPVGDEEVRPQLRVLLLGVGGEHGLGAGEPAPRRRRAARRRRPR